MLYTLEKINKQILSLFPSREYHLCLDALMEEICKGEVIVDDLNTPQSGAVIIYPNSGEVYIYLFGKRQSEFIISLNEHFHTTIKPKALERGLRAYQFYPLSGWTIMDEAELIVDKDNYFILNIKKFHQNHADWKNKIPSGYSLKKIESKEVFDEVSSFWKSFVIFLKKGFSYYITHDDTNEIVSYCHNKYVTQNACEPGVTTIEKFHKKGFATLVTCSVIEEAITRNLRLVWECWRGNEASIRLATKLGFEYLCDAQFHIGYFDDLVHYWNTGYFYLIDKTDALKAAKLFTKALELNKTLKRQITPNYYYYAAQAFAMVKNNGLALDCLKKTINNTSEEGLESLRNKILNDSVFIELRRNILKEF